jgi:hypothetical protein
MYLKIGRTELYTEIMPLPARSGYERTRSDTSTCHEWWFGRAHVIIERLDQKPLNHRNEIEMLGVCVTF